MEKITIVCSDTALDCIEQTPKTCEKCGGRIYASPSSLMAEAKAKGNVEFMCLRCMLNKVTPIKEPDVVGVKEEHNFGLTGKK